MKLHLIVLLIIWTFFTACGGSGSGTSTSDRSEINTAPVANAQGITLTKDTSKIITLTASDVDEDTLTYTVLSNPSHGTLGGTAPSLTYTPRANYFGSDSFTFKVNDGIDDSLIATVGITINNIKNGIVIVLPKKTGQTKSYYTEGSEVIDGTVKDDGYYQKGTIPSYTRDDDNETVLDNITGLMWQDDEAVKSLKKPWLNDTNTNTCFKYEGEDQACFDTTGDTATTYCKNLVMGGYEDWRLPTSFELEGIVNYEAETPSLDTTKFKNTKGNYWSSTSAGGRSAWFVGFYSGQVDTQGKDVSYYVRCVRAGQ